MNRYSNWQNCLQLLQNDISEQEFGLWVKPLHASVQAKTLLLLAPNNYVQSYINKNLLELIEQIVLSTDSDIARVVCQIGGEENHDKTKNPSQSKPNLEQNERPLTQFPNSVLNPDYTFYHHVEGSSNQLARIAAMQVGENPGKEYNPLFIYGGVGLGKTHLMQAAGHKVLEKNPNAKVYYIGSEMFLNNMVKALQNNKMEDFKRFYRSADVLLIDDIQFFARKERSQEEFFHTFNALLEGKSQVIITSDRIPQAIDNIEERLISRFGSGLTISVEPPDLETRIAILSNKAKLKGVELDHDVAFFIASHIRSNVRELEGAFQLVLANAQFTCQPIDINLTKLALRDQLNHEDKKLSIDNIQQTVAEYYKIRIADLLSKKRSRDIARPRQLAMYFSREYTELSLPQIGDRFGGRDHTTVLHACGNIQKLLLNDSKLQEDHKNLQQIFRV